MTTDLHSVLLEAITARQERAAEAASSWDLVGIATTGTPPFVAPADVLSHIVAESPDAVLRQTAEDLDVLTRHYVCADLNDCHTCRDEFHPCPEILSLARRYGLGVEAEGNQP